MTIEEAIEIFKEVRAEVLAKETELSKQVFENLGIKAVDLAIKVLEQQPCEDCISREAVKEMLREEWTKYIPMELDINLSYVLEKISELPSVTPSIPSVENDFNLGYNCGYADAMFDISEGE